MARYIDADKLKKDVLNLQDCYNGFSDTYDKACIIGVIDEQPSAQPEIIRCKDCKWSDTRPGVWDCHNPVFGDGYAYYSPPCMREDDYCSRAERRTE